jgi:hypothetical protein
MRPATGFERDPSARVGVNSRAVLFPAWETFYVIVGSAAGALTGLMFVVIALVADFEGSERQIEAFGTPTVIHFSAALLLSALLAAPWPGMTAARIALASYGALGIVYMCVVLRRARQQTDYKPVMEDWLFHFVLPIAAYTAVLVAAGAMPYAATPFLFVIAAAAVLLVVIGIHNAWDTVTYVIVARWERRRSQRSD